MELDIEDNIQEKRLAVVDPDGYIELSPDVSETMGWEQGAEIMGSRVGDMLVLERFRPRCIICGFPFETKELNEKFICQSCADRARKKRFYKYRGNMDDA